MEGAGVSADPTAMLVARRPSSGAPSSAVSIYADGFGIDVGPVRGTEMRLEARTLRQADQVWGAPARGTSRSLLEPPPGGKSVTVLSDFGKVYMAAGATSGGAVTIGCGRGHRHCPVDCHPGR